MGNHPSLGVKTLTLIRPAGDLCWISLLHFLLTVSNGPSIILNSYTYGHSHLVFWGNWAHCSVLPWIIFRLYFENLSKLPGDLRNAVLYRNAIKQLILVYCDITKCIDSPPLSLVGTNIGNRGPLLSYRREDVCQHSLKKTFHFTVTSLIAKVYSYLCVVRGNESSVAEVDSKPSAWTEACAALMDVGKNTVKWWWTKTCPPLHAPCSYSQLPYNRKCCGRQRSHSLTSESSLRGKKKYQETEEQKGKEGKNNVGWAASEVGWPCVNPEMQHRKGEGGGGSVEERGGRKNEEKKERREEINISATWPLKPLPMTANIMKRYGSREGGRNEKDKKRTVK